jgi:hypothetical protein
MPDRSRGGRPASGSAAQSQRSSNARPAASPPKQSASSGAKPASVIVFPAGGSSTRRVGTYLYGRRMYEVMVAWETWDVAGVVHLHYRTRT